MADIVRSEDFDLVPTMDTQHGTASLFHCTYVSPVVLFVRLRIQSQTDLCLIDFLTFWRRLTFCQPGLAEVKL